MEDYLNSLVPQPEPETHLSRDQQSEIARMLNQIEAYLVRLKDINEAVEAYQKGTNERGEVVGYRNQEVKDYFNNEYIREINNILNAIERIYDEFIHKNKYSVSDQYRQWYHSVKERGLLLYEAYPRCMILFINYGK